MRRLASGFVLSMFVAASLSANTYTVTNTADSGAGSLRQAILNANANAGLDTVAFNVSGAGCDGSGVCTIAPTATLPIVSEAVVIDGYTQSGAAPNTSAQGALNTVLKIVLSAVNIPGQYGLFFSGTGGSTVRGLVVNGGFDKGIVSFFSNNDTVTGCFVGTDAAGTAIVSNTSGIWAEFADDFRVGGPLPADRNLVTGNTSTSVSIQISVNSTTRGNLIGTDVSGADVLPANTNTGIALGTNSGGALIQGNVVGGAVYGMNLGTANDSTFGASVLGNGVGTDLTGTVDLGNGVAGILIQGRQIAVGGIAPGEGNVIAYNHGAGVLVNYSTVGTFDNPIRGNSIFSNGEGAIPSGISPLGIDLGNLGGFAEGGLTLNDLGDADAGPNRNQNFPVITSAVSGGNTTTIQGRLNSAASTQFTLDFYSNDACVGRPQDFLEGRTYLGTDSVTTDASGNATINTILPGVTLGAGERVTATATDPTGNTSEFSQRIVLASNPSSGNPAGVAGVALTGFNFLAGATVTVGGLPAPSVVVNDYNTVTVTTPNLPPGSLNNVTLTNSDGSSGTLPNGWIADFLDVPGNQQFYAFVTTLVRNAITVGVGGGQYGVAQGTKRQQMAVFLLKARYGLCYVPPPCAGVFPDVPCSSNFAPWIEALAAQGITTGCGGGLFCPDNFVTRRQMAVFLLKTKYGSSYAPPACTGLFGDVPCPSAPAVNFIEELYNEQITGGCQANPLLYCPDGTSTRGQMAVFIVKTFGLQ